MSNYQERAQFQGLSQTADNHEGKSKLEDISQPRLRLNQLNRVDDLAKILYERLLRKSGKASENNSRAFTCPDDMNTTSSQESTLAALTEQISQSTIDIIEPQLPSYEEFEDREVPLAAEKADHGTLSDKINEYMRSLNLEDLSQQEIQYLDEDLAVSQSFSQNTSSQHTSFTGPTQPTKPEETRIRRVCIQNNPKDAMKLAANILLHAGFASRTSFQVINTHRHTRGGPQGLKNLSQKLSQYAGILQATAETIRTTLPMGEQQNLGWNMVKDSEQVLKDIHVLLLEINAGFVGQTVLILAAFVLDVLNHKGRVNKSIADLESLKSTISIMLQVYQIHALDRRHGARDQ